MLICCKEYLKADLIIKYLLEETKYLFENIHEKDDVSLFIYYLNLLILPQSIFILFSLK